MEASRFWPDMSLEQWMNPDYTPGLVSVIIPTFNRVQFIVAAMESVWNQTYRPIEMVVVDDGSTDETEGTVLRWMAEHDDTQFRSRYLRQRNRGAPAARNRGLVMSNGEYIQYLDSDDLLHPEKVSRQIALLRDGEKDFIFSTTGSFEHQPVWNTSVAYTSSFEGEYRYLEGFLNRLRKPQPWSTEGGIYTREACIKIGPWDEQLPFDQDWEYNIRFLILRPTIGTCDGLLSLKRNHDFGRVGDSRGSGLGPQHQMKAVRRVDVLLSESDLPLNDSIFEGLTLHYLAVVPGALRRGDDDTARTASKYALDVAPRSKWLFATLMLRALTSMPGASSVYRYGLEPVRKLLKRV